MLETIIHNIQANSPLAYHAVLAAGIACMLYSVALIVALLVWHRKETKPYQLPRFNPDPRVMDKNWGIIKLRPAKE